MEIRTLDIVQLVLILITITEWVILLVLYFVSKQFRNPPGSLIAWDIAGTMINLLTIVFQIIKVSMNSGFSYEECIALWGAQCYGGNLCYFYLSSLCLEIYLTAKNPLDSRYKQHANIYHIVNHSLTIILTIVFIFLSDLQSVGTVCRLQDAIWVALFSQVIWVILAILSVTWIILAFRIMKSTQKYLYRYIVFWVAYVLIAIANSCFVIATKDDEEILYICIQVMMLFATTWRILEITVLNNYFNSMKDEPSNRLSDTYIPLNQAFFQANMIHGVQVVLITLTQLFDKLQTKKDRKTGAKTQIGDRYQEVDFKEFKDWTFDKLKGILAPEWLQGNQIIIREYAPTVCQEIRNENQVSNIYLRDLFLEQQFDQIQQNTGNPGGRSGCFFYFTTDHKFIIKSISEHEKQVLFGGFLQDYFCQVHESLLARIYGVYEIKVGNQTPFSFILMGNIEVPGVEVLAQFDIKGSKVNRRSINISAGSIDSLEAIKVYKDLDFENFIGNITLYSHNILFERLMSDVCFLEEHNIMDYSLLVKICKPTAASNQFLFHGEEHSYCIGIIDFLQQFTSKKQAELELKAVFNKRETISVQDPAKYAARFLKKISEYLQVPN